MLTSVQVYNKKIIKSTETYEIRGIWHDNFKINKKECSNMMMNVWFGFGLVFAKIRK
jgi:hypothetical protein